MVRLKATNGVTTIYGITGEIYRVDEEGTIEVPEGDAGPLRMAGFVDAKPHIEILQQSLLAEGA